MGDAVKTKVDELRDALSRRKMQDQSDAAVADTDAASGVGNTDATLDDAPTDAACELPDAATALAAAQAKAGDWQERYVRTVAEMENLRKRAERERADAITFANERLIKELIPVLDHLDAALNNIPDAARSGDPADAAVRAFAEGVELTRRQFLSILERSGFVVIGADPGAAFDPTCHEAIGHVDAEGLATGAIVTCHRAGYRLHARVIRASLVTVAR